MFPAVTENDLLHRGVRQPVLPRDDFDASVGSQRRSLSPNLSDELLGIHGLSVSGTYRHSPVLTSVLGVRLWRVPAKVSQLVVGCVAVVMTALHTVWTRSDERLQDQSMDVSRRVANTNVETFELTAVTDDLQNRQLLTNPMIVQTRRIGSRSPHAGSPHAPIVSDHVADVPRTETVSDRELTKWRHDRHLPSVFPYKKSRQAGGKPALRMPPSRKTIIPYREAA